MLDTFPFIGRISKEASRRRKTFGKGEKANAQGEKIPQAGEQTNACRAYCRTKTVGRTEETTSLWCSPTALGMIDLKRKFHFYLCKTLCIKYIIHNEKINERKVSKIPRQEEKVSNNCVFPILLRIISLLNKTVHLNVFVFTYRFNQ